MEEIIERAGAAADGLGPEAVYAGFSLGVVPAQALAQTRPGALGALLFHGCVPPSALGSGWPQGLPVQVHTAEHDPWTGTEDVRAFLGEVPGAEVFVCPGSAHLFADPGSGEYQDDAARLLLERALRFLARSADTALRRPPQEHRAHGPLSPSSAEIPPEATPASSRRSRRERSAPKGASW